MGFFDRKSSSLFDDMFDFNKDGALDPIEQCAQIDFMINDGPAENEVADDELAMTGLDRVDLDMVDEDELREDLEDAGLDLDDFGDF